jgi:hypothetical protein
VSERVLDTCGCCEPRPEQALIDNRPALGAIGYRIGTYGTFRAEMLARVSSRPELRTWTARSSEDYGVALLEMWAYIADILTFYQERVANEAFLRTAQSPDSLVHLAHMLDYRPAPGVSAMAELAFRLDPDKHVDLPAHLRVQSVPATREEKPQKFETSETVAAASGLNEMRLRPVRTPAGPLRKADRWAYVRDVGAGVEVGDHLLVVGAERREEAGSERWDIRRVVTVEPDPEHGLIAIELTPRLGSRFRRVEPSSEDQQLYVMRLQVWPFGYNAPDWELIPPDLRETGAVFAKSWAQAQLPQDPDHPERLFLDDVYPQVVAGDWAVLMTPNAVEVDGRTFGRGYNEVYEIERAEPTVRSDYAMTARVTRLDLDTPKRGEPPEHIDIFPLRGTSVLTQAEQLERVELLAEASGDQLELDGAFPELTPERRMLVVGVPVGGEKEQVEGALVRKAEVLGDPPYTLVTLARPLSVAYQLETVRLYANLARATHGETVRDEVLGSGDASREFQSFGLSKPRLTYVPRPGGAEDVSAELEIRVDGVLWHEVPSFYGRGPEDRVYTLRANADAETTVQFGDGTTGARLPTGRNNVLATYRHGIGRTGNLGAGALRTLLDRPVGLRAAHNPAATGIGVDPEPPEMTRQNVPNTVRTFGRIVSLRDFEDAAREAAGVAKARATWEWDGEVQAVHLTVAGDEGIAITGDALTGLVGRLNARRDPNRKLVVRPHVPVPVEVEAVVRVHPDHLARDVVPAARTALGAYLSFKNLDFGRAVHLSDVYRAIQDVPGVVSADVDVLRFKPFGTDEEYARFVRERGGTFHMQGGLETPDQLQAHLLVRASELPVIEAPEDARVRDE